MKAHILIVEDEAILYERLRRFLANNHYTIDKYTPSVEVAIARINAQRPDLILLDINLEGELTGLHLGKKLSETYGIPFIYVTNYDDNETFYQGMATNHKHFMVKTKPNINTDELLRVIQTVLNNTQKQQSKKVVKEGIMGLVDYKENLKDLGRHDLNMVNVPYRDILYFSVKGIRRKDEEGNVKIHKLKENYIWLLTEHGEVFFIKKSLKGLMSTLPDYFTRINEGYVINLLPKKLKGRVNGTHVKIGDEVLKITHTYTKEFEKKLHRYYQV
jgi:CheY-like chemotaxis protein